MNKLRLVAPTNILDAASRVTTALTTTALYTTDPLAQQVAPGRRLARSRANFTNVFRAEVGKDQSLALFCREPIPDADSDPPHSLDSSNSGRRRPGGAPA
jgi:hypothetical protein